MRSIDKYFRAAVFDWRGIISVLWLIGILIGFVKSVYSIDYWNTWYFVSLIATLFYGIVFYIFYFTKEVLKMLSTTILGKYWYLLAIIIFSVAIILALIIILLTGAPQNRLVLLAMPLITILVFTICDICIKVMLQKTADESTDRASDMNLKEKIDDYSEFIKYVDIPTAFAIFVVAGFSQFKITGFDIQIFTAGAYAFELISFNAVFAIFLISDAVKSQT